MHPKAVRNIRWLEARFTCRTLYIDEKKDNHDHPRMVLAYISIRRDAFCIDLLVPDIYLSVGERALLHRNVYVYLVICNRILKLYNAWS